MKNNTTIDPQSALVITEKARAYIMLFLKAKDINSGFRFGIKKSGCSGYAYIADIAKEPNSNEIRVNHNGISLFLQHQHLPILKGTVIDLIEKELGQKQLVFQNPNVVDTCGCGESFTVKNNSEKQASNQE